MLQNHILKGWTAIRWAKRQGLNLSKYNDPVEEARDELSPSEAEEIAKEDPGLIYIDLSDITIPGTVALTEFYNYQMWMDHRPKGCKFPEEDE